MDPNLQGKTPDDLAIERLREFERAALARSPDGYWLAFSGGKDSVVILDLAKRAGVKFAAHYSATGIDPPELVRFVRTFADVQIRKPKLSIVALCRKRSTLPRRAARFCCEVLKETGGDGHVIVTGVRWEESNRRSQRKMAEPCYRKGNRSFLHPIIDWSTADVWAYIRERGLRYCSLYDEGWRRLGCVLCPMTRDVDRQLERWPALGRLWRRACGEAWKKKAGTFRTADDMWVWWLNRDSPATSSDPVLFEDDPGMGDDGHAA